MRECRERSLLQGVHGEDLAGCILEPVLAAMMGAESAARLGRVRVPGILEVLHLLELLELLVVAYVGVIGRQAHEIVHETEDDEEGGYGREDEHDLGPLHVVLAEELHLLGAADLHVLEPRVFGEEEAWRGVRIHLVLILFFLVGGGGGHVYICLV